MIPSLEELRKRLVPVLAPGSESNSFKGNPQISAAPTRPDPPSSPKFLVLHQNLPKFGPHSRVCRLCRRPPSVLSPYVRGTRDRAKYTGRHLRAGSSTISYSSE